MTYKLASADPDPARIMSPPNLPSEELQHEQPLFSLRWL